MITTITTNCPHCNKDIVITGIKLVFDNPSQPTKTEPLKSKGYVGWQPKEEDKSVEQLPIPDVLKTDNTIRIDNSAPDADTNKLIGEQIKKQEDENRAMRTELKELQKVKEIKKQEEDPNPNNLKVETHKEEPVKQLEPKKEEDELVPLLKKLIPLLDTKIYPELHKIVSTLVVGEEAAKEEKPKVKLAW
jgi:hypothetical protein